MRLVRLHLHAFGPFSGCVLDFGSGSRQLVLVHGPNEAGKSSALRAVTDLRFGIPQQSRDNFVHPHPSMRVGGVFVDREGREHALVRRKGRGSTLLLADFDRDDPATDTPVPPPLEALLSCGLSREEYEFGFGLDHDRLRRGAAALLEGKGDVGAALFEASAGVRSIPKVLDRLDHTARGFFMPGTRGKNAPINEALADFERHQSAYRQALVRPAQWAELFRRHRDAEQALAGLERRHEELQRRLLSIGELRAVAPLLAALDHALRMLEELGDAPLLPEDAAAERAAAESGLAAARGSAQEAAAAALRHRERLAALQPDGAVLERAAAIRRLSAAIESWDRHRAELVAAEAEADAESARLAALAAAIAPGMAPQAVLQAAPTAARRTAIDERVRTLEQARQALAQHREALRRHAAAASESAAQPLPPAPACLALRQARAEAARHETSIARLAGLPAQIGAAGRRLAAALEDLGLADEAALRRARPLLDAAIDEALQVQRAGDTRVGEHRRRIEEIEAALGEARLEHDRLLEQGAVPTPEDVLEARRHRDETWTRLRRVQRGLAARGAAMASLLGEPDAASLRRDTAQASPLERVAPVSPPEDAASASAADEAALAAAYERTVLEADRLADALAADHQRAARLQSCRHRIAALQTDQARLRDELAAMLREAEARDAAWREALSAAALPCLPPAGLREWQARLARAREAAEALQALDDEHERLRAVEARLAGTLREALQATGLAGPAADAGLGMLAGLAEEAEAEIRRRENARAAAEGAQAQHARERQRMAEREAELERALQAAHAALAPSLAELMLAGEIAEAGATVIRTRLDEFDALLQAQARLAAAEARRRAAGAALALLQDDVGALARALGDSHDGPPRLYVESVARRLDEAEAAQKQQALARQALEQALEVHRAQQVVAAGHEARLAELCAAARVESSAQLPQAEERSRRRREAQRQADDAAARLAQASRRGLDELRTLLAGQDAARMDADEAACREEQARLDEALREARRREEAARHALQAIDGADTAAAEREAMERAAARVRANLPPWIRARLAHALLGEALRRFRDRAQGPMLRSASAYFGRMTGGAFERLVGDEDGERPVLLAERTDGSRVPVEGLSEGTRDQLYLALRLAALEMRRAAGVDLPVLLDDVLMTSDDRRAGLMLQALADFSQGGQVIVFTHHRHLLEVARRSVPEERLAVVELQPDAGTRRLPADAGAKGA